MLSYKNQFYLLNIFNNYNIKKYNLLNRTNYSELLKLKKKNIFLKKLNEI